MTASKGNFDFTTSKYLLSARSKNQRVGFLEAFPAGAGVCSLRALVPVVLLLALTDHPGGLVPFTWFSLLLAVVGDET